MTKTIRTVGGLFAAIALVSTATISFAQEHAPPSPEQREARMHEHMEQRARKLHDVLNLRPDQDAALRTLMTAMAPPPGPGPEHALREKMAAATTPERLDWAAKRMAEHQVMFEKRAEAIKQFYAVLSPEQKRAFDALPGMMRDGEHHGPKGMWDHGMGHDGPDAPPRG